MLYVNTIEFEGRKACINSYSDHPLLVASMNKQREAWAAKYHNATVKTERMTEADTIALVSHGRAQGDHLYNHAYAIGQASLA